MSSGWGSAQRLSMRVSRFLAILIEPESMKSSEIRTQVPGVLRSQGPHDRAVEPARAGNDPTLLFTNSGMVQFKDVFLGQDKRPYVRATTSQRCVRAGGKHNDLENVGYTARHHTFFEMLGNFSFGDYFKRDAIRFAWELLTKVYGLSADSSGPPSITTTTRPTTSGRRRSACRRSAACASATSPARPVSERQLLADGRHRPVRAVLGDLLRPRSGHRRRPARLAGCRRRPLHRDLESRVHAVQPRRRQATLHPLPKPSVDTGMGLERIAAVLQGVHSNYEIDLFQELIKAAARETGAKDLASNSLQGDRRSHPRVRFLIVDGVIPGNEGRGYVLRRIIRRAIRHGYKLGQTKPFFHKLVADLAKAMGEAYPELLQAKRARRAGAQAGGGALRRDARERHEDARRRAQPRRQACSTARPCSSSTTRSAFRSISPPTSRASAACASTTPASRRRWSASASARAPRRSFSMAQAVEYSGHEDRVPRLRARSTLEREVVALYKDGTTVEAARRGRARRSWCSTARRSTPSPAARSAIAASWSRPSGTFAVEDTQKIQADVFGHHGELEDRAAEGRRHGAARRSIPSARARARMRNHSATHLMHKALREVLGRTCSRRARSSIAESTRFDFAHNAPMTARRRSARSRQLVNARDPRATPTSRRAS